MIKIKEYTKPKSIEEAAFILESRNDALLVSGGAFLHLSSKNAGVAVDLQDAGLDFIIENEDNIEIGAMTTFKELETSPILKKYFNNIISCSVKNIVSVPLRNVVTIGATIYSKYGFSDLITALLVLDCSVVLYKRGTMSLSDYLKSKRTGKDILEKIILKKEDLNASFQMVCSSHDDCAVLNAAVSKCNGNYKIAVGLRPGVAKLAVKAAHFLKSVNINEETALKAGEIAAEELDFETNYYKKELCKEIIKKGILEVNKCY